MSEARFSEPEIRLFGLQAVSPPEGGLAGAGKLVSHTGTAKVHTDELTPYFQQHFRLGLHEGTFNLELDGPITWPEASVILTTAHQWEVCPIVLKEAAVGIAIRGNLERPDLLEIISPVRLRARLGDIEDGALVPFRLLAGSTLKPAG
jgi:hypothetical protein